VRRLDMIPIAVVVRNIAAGSLCERYGVTEGRELDFPVVELVYRSRQHDYPIINESHILALGVSTPDEVRSTVRIATKTNAVLRSFMERRRFRLVDLWLEFGRQNGEVFLGDAVIPDVMRVLDVETTTIHDGSRFRLGIGDYTAAYVDLSKRFLA
jgi:phosphoribosylaminoimidazole-succinocarboxamide synthase